MIGIEIPANERNTLRLFKKETSMQKLAVLPLSSQCQTIQDLFVLHLWEVA